MQKLKILYWLLPLVILASQMVFTFNSVTQIRYEELAESVRNVFWLENKTIYDGVSSNVGWYGTQLIIYKIFGFDLHTTKYFRLILQLISLICLAAVLKKYMEPKKALVPLLAIGLSPTLLYFNTLQTSYGTDLQYFPIALYLIVALDFKKRWQALVKQSLLWVLAMIAWMSYPTFAFYLPIIGILYIWKLFNHFGFKKWFILLGNVVLSAAFFILPLGAALLYVKDRNLLLYDQVTKSGIFRGAGNFYPDGGIFFYNLINTFSDLFSSGGSYYFEAAAGDFSYILPLFAVLVILLINLLLIFKNTEFKKISLLIFGLLFLSLIAANLTFDPSGFPGIRRSTGALAAIYALFTIAWYFVTCQKWEPQAFKIILVSILLVIPLHHLMVYPINYFHLKETSRYQYSHVFGLSETPAKSLEHFVSQVQKEDLKLGCKDQEGNLKTCRYSEAYAAVAGSCLWNNFNCKNILGYDEKEKKFIPLNIKLWEDYYWDH